jgi:hypothetical protein
MMVGSYSVVITDPVIITANTQHTSNHRDLALNNNSVTFYSSGRNDLDHFTCKKVRMIRTDKIVTKKVHARWAFPGWWE